MAFLQGTRIGLKWGCGGGWMGQADSAHPCLGVVWMVGQLGMLRLGWGGIWWRKASAILPVQVPTDAQPHLLWRNDSHLDLGLLSSQITPTKRDKALGRKWSCQQTPHILFRSRGRGVSILEANCNYLITSAPWISNIYRNRLSKEAFFSTVFYFPCVFMSSIKRETSKNYILALLGHLFISPVGFNLQEIARKMNR